MPPENNMMCCFREEKEIKFEHQAVLFNSHNSPVKQVLFPFLQKQLILKMVQKLAHSHRTGERC